MIDDEEQPPADRQAVERISQGDVEALAELYDRHVRAIYSLARRIVSDAADAEEVVQDVFTQVWRQSARYERARASVAGWLLMMTRARALDRLRRRQARPDIRSGDLALPHMPAAIVNQESRVITQQQVQALKGALGTLPDTVAAHLRTRKSGRCSSRRSCV